MTFASYYTTSCVWPVQIYNLTIFRIFLLVYDIFHTWWYVRCRYKRVSRFREYFFPTFLCWNYESLINEIDSFSFHLSLLIQNNRKRVLVQAIYMFSRLSFITLITFTSPFWFCVFNLFLWDNMGLIGIIWDYLGFTVTSHY